MIDLWPAKKAFVVAFAYISITRLIGDLSRSYSKHESIIQALYRIKRSLIRNLQSDKLPQFCSKLVFLYPVFQVALSKLFARASFRQKKHTVIFLSAFLSAYTSYTDYTRRVEKQGPTQEIVDSRLDNISNELTTLVLARAIDSVIRGPLTKSRRGRNTIYDSTQFTVSCFIIMFSWFYYPHNMQNKYRLWITKMANMDNDLVTALRLLRNKKLVYGVTGKYTTLLEDTAQKIGLARECGNTNKSIPLPCNLVHANTFDSCEIHALWRFWRGMKSAMLIYLPLNTILALKQINYRKRRTKSDVMTSQLTIIFNIILKSLRSSTFLAAFIALNWYSVCLVRSRIGPKLFPNATAQEIEDTWGPAFGSLMCGLSIFLEEKQRRPELSLFGTFIKKFSHYSTQFSNIYLVFAKSISILLPNKFAIKYRRLDRLLFASSVAVLVTNIKKNPKSVKGVFGLLLQSMF